jgi:hypothetical protein
MVLYTRAHFEYAVKCHAKCNDGNEIEVLQLTRMLSFPLNREETVLISSSLWARNSASHIELVTRNPLIFHSCKHSLSWTSFRQHVWTVAPRPANSSTMAYLKVTYSNRFFTKKIKIKIKAQANYISLQNNNFLGVKVKPSHGFLILCIYLCIV